MSEKKRVFGYIEVIFDVSYLLFAFAIGGYFIFANQSQPQLLSGIMAIILASGDSFHLIPRVAAIIAKNDAKYTKAMGVGKFVTSISMTLFYVLMWHLVHILFNLEIMTIWTMLAYALAIIRIVLCVMPQNNWLSEKPPVLWGILRNLPFLFLGLMPVILYSAAPMHIEAIRLLPIAVVFSFVFYLPVVVFANKYPIIGMLMLPKTCCYIWMLLMFLGL